MISNRKQVTTNMTGAPQNMFCITTEHKAVATIFFNILQQYFQLPILGILDMSDHFHQKG